MSPVIENVVLAGLAATTVYLAGGPVWAAVVVFNLVFVLWCIFDQVKGTR